MPPRLRKYIFWLLRLLIILAGVAFIAWNVNWTDRYDESGQLVEEGIVTTLSGADWRWLAGGLLLMGLVFPIQTTRWYILMRARRLEVTFPRTLRLFMVGHFFNFCMPMATGGDVIKAYYVAARSARRADAIMSIIVDRTTGLFALMLYAGIVGLFLLADPTARQTTVVVWCLVAAAFIGALLYASVTRRRLMPVETLLKKLPGRRLWSAIDGAAVAYRHHPLAVVSAVLTSFLGQTMMFLATILAGYALGMSTPMVVMLAALPLVYMSAALPSYQGLGWMEAVAFALLQHPEQATANQIISMLMLARLYMLVYGLIGSVGLLHSDIHMHPAVDEGVALEEEEEEVANDE